MSRTKHESQRLKNLLFQKVGIFIDAENIEMSGLKHHDVRTDYKKILERVGDREITRILYYKPEYKEISSDFESFWYGLGGEIKRPAKNADSFMVIDAVTMADKLDVVILLGGDKDLLPLVWYLKSSPRCQELVKFAIVDVPLGGFGGFRGPRIAVVLWGFRGSRIAVVFWGWGGGNGGGNF